MTSSEMQKNVY